jgi:hypothetical protein
LNRILLQTLIVAKFLGKFPTFVQDVPFIVPLRKAALSHRKPASAGTSVTAAVFRSTVQETAVDSTGS